jgi:4-amino-4-deoxy-L-arabinose transferase-like glycosyltransferase
MPGREGQHQTTTAIDGGPTPGRLARWAPAALVVLIVAAGAGLRAHHLGRECFDEDELYAVYIQGTSPKAVGMVMARDTLHANHPPLMTVPYLFWNALVGTSEARVRLLPLLCSVFTIVLVYLLGARLGGRTAGLLAAGVIVFNPLHVAYAQEARQYALLTALVALAHLLFLRCLQHGRCRDLLAYFVVCLLTALTHYFGVIALFAHGFICVWTLARGDQAARHAAGRLFLTLGLAAIPCLPLILLIRFQASISGQWSHLAAGSWSDIIACLRDVAAVHTPFDHGLSGGILIAALVSIGFLHCGGQRLPVTPTGDRPPVPRGLAVPVILLGTLAALGALWVVPRLLLPLGRQILMAETVGYPEEMIERELQVVFQLSIAFPAALAAVGFLLLAWPALLRLITRPTTQGETTTAGVPVPLIVGGLLVTPVVGTWVVSLLGIPFLQTRNLIVLVPVLALAIGLGLAALSRHPIGRTVAVCAAGLLLALTTNYRPIATCFGGDGYPIGSHTADWRGLNIALEQGEPGVPLLTAKTPFTDPMLYYQKRFAPQRVSATPDVLNSLPPRFLLVHVAQHDECAGLLRALQERGVRLTEVHRANRLVLFEVFAGSVPTGPHIGRKGPDAPAWVTRGVSPHRAPSSARQPEKTGSSAGPLYPRGLHP